MKVGLSSWIIQDGNYSDFTVGETARFALEFCTSKLRSVSATTPSHTQTRPAYYDITAIVRLDSPEVSVLDFGFLAYREQTVAPEAGLNQFVAGEVYVGIDPFFYFEYLHAKPGMPELRYSWRIDQILLETTPWISTRDASGREVRTRDESQQSFRSVQQTDAWKDDGGHAHYVLDCHCIGND